MISYRPQSLRLPPRLAAVILTSALALALGAQAQAPAQSAAAGSDADLAKQLSNPISDLVSVPFQFNWEQGVGDRDATRTVLNVQPVVPFSLNDDWNLIGRWIMPFVSQPSLAPGSDSSYGLSDILFSAFFAPKNTKSGLVWGIGPAVSLPMTDDPLIGSGQWSAGPTGVVLKMSGPWTYGVLASQIWSFKSTSDLDRPRVNRAFVQPFLSYTTAHAVSFVVQSEATYDHEAARGEKWTVPINLQVSKVTRFGPFPFSVLGGWGYYAESPNIGPDRKLRIAFTILLPRGK